MVEQRAASVIETSRKALHQQSSSELISTDTLLNAVNLASNPPSGTKELELLSFTIVLLRQFSAVVTLRSDIYPNVELAYRALIPAFRPNGSIAALILSQLSSHLKPNQIRAVDALTSASRLALILQAAGGSTSSSSSSIPHLLQPLFHAVLRDGTSTRPNLVAISIIVESIPDDQIPVDLLGTLLQDVRTGDVANIRCAIIATLLGRLRRSASPSLTENEKDKIMIEPLLPHLAPRDDETAAVHNLSRYLLPTLFKTHPASFRTLLDVLGSSEAIQSDQQDYFAAWITVASFGVTNGLSTLSELSPVRLQEAITHEDDKIRIMAFELIGNCKDVLEPRVLDLIRESLKWNDAIPNAGGRTDMASAIYAFLTHFKIKESAALKNEKRSKSPESKCLYRSQIDAAQAFHQWFLDDYLTPAIGQSRRHPALRGIFALKLLRLYIDTYGNSSEIRHSVYTAERVDLLFSCLASEFADARVAATAILVDGPSPLAGYESLQSPSVKILLESAYMSMNLARKTQAEAGRAALCVIFTKVVQLSPQHAIPFVSDLIDALERNIRRSEEDLASGIQNFPLHGPLCAITEVLRCVRLEKEESQAMWRPVFHRLLSLVDRVWRVTQRVISLGRSTDAEEGVSSTDTATAAHEIARAYEVLGDRDDAETGNDTVDHTNLLSGCWRATSDAAELLSVMLCTSFATTNKQTIWSIAQVDRAGFSFLTWLHEIRHRGTFSRVAPALGQVVEAIKGNAELGYLVKEWLEHELQVVASDELSTLRRSAALPYSILAIVAGDQELLDIAVDRLMNLARVDGDSSDSTKVHAMNCLKIVLLDAKQTKFLRRYFEKTLTVALDAFGSSNWNVRNVGLILFSTIAHRSLSTGRSQEVFGTRSALLLRQTLSSWNAKYPSIFPYLASCLRRYRRQVSTDLSAHSSLFPILIIIRSLRWSSEGQQLANDLFLIVEPYLGSVEWQIREVASQALSSLMSPDEAVAKAKITTIRVSHKSEDLNIVHGRLLFLRRLYADVIQWDKVDDDDKKLLELNMLDTLQCWEKCRSAAIPAAVLDCIETYSRISKPIMTALLEEEIKIAGRILLQDVSTVNRPGIDLLGKSCAAVILHSAAPNVLTLLRSGISEDVQLDVLNRIAADASLQTMNTLVATIRICSSGDDGNAVKLKALEVISDWPSTSTADREIASLSGALVKLIEMSRCLPLRQTALVALARSISSFEGSSSVTFVTDIAALLEEASNEIQPEPTRSSALRSLGHLSSFLFGSKISIVPRETHARLQRTLQRLLDDDDESIRSGAASIVSRGLGLSRSVVHGKGVALWWEWLQNHVKVATEFELWEQWLWETVSDVSAVEADVAKFSQPVGQTQNILFLEEPPNIFRDSLTTARYAATVLSTSSLLKTSSVWARQHSALEERVTELIQVRGMVSPIEDSWDARDVLLQRLAIQRHALGL